jgi:hypothetical protein
MGVLVLVNPWLLGFDEFGRATWNAVVTGVAVILVGAVAAARSSMAAWGNLLLAVWLFVSPWVVGYTEFRSASRNAWFIAVMLALFAFIRLVTGLHSGTTVAPRSTPAEPARPKRPGRYVAAGAPAEVS